MKRKISTQPDVLAGVGGGFDPGDEAAAAIIRREPLGFIDDLTEAQRITIREALARAFEKGLGTLATARSFRGSVRLTAAQQGDVENYRKLLELGSEKALSLDLRDRRFDRTVAKAVGGGKPLSTVQIDRMVERYRESQLAYRAETIAATAYSRATGEARYVESRQTVADAGISAGRVRRVWHATNDARTRPAHAFMDGQEVGIDEPFIDGDGNELRFPGDPDAPPETSTACRCVVTNRILGPDEAAD